MEDIPGYPSFTKMEPLDRGLSGDQKYRVETESGRRLLLRLSAAGELGQRQAEYDSLRALAAYRAEGLPFEGSSIILGYLDSHRHLLDGRPHQKN